MDESIFPYDLTLQDFANLFGTSTDDFSKSCVEYIFKNDFHYRVATDVERETFTRGYQTG